MTFNKETNNENNQEETINEPEETTAEEAVEFGIADEIIYYG